MTQLWRLTRTVVTLSVMMAGISSLSIGTASAAAESTLQNAGPETAATTTVSTTLRQQEEAEVKQDMPAAVQQVKEAKEQGTSAVEALVGSLKNSPSAAAFKAGGAPKTTPKEFALAVALKPLIKSVASRSGRTKVEKPAEAPSSEPSALSASFLSKAHAAYAYCWFAGSWIRNGNAWYVGSWWVGDIYIYHGIWCGNGYEIYYNGLGYWKGARAEFPYCENSDMAAGWDWYHYSWAHGKTDEYFGSYTPWGSCGFGSWHSRALRIADNGYYDFYNDF